MGGAGELRLLPFGVVMSFVGATVLLRLARRVGHRRDLTRAA